MISPAEKFVDDYLSEYNNFEYTFENFLKNIDDYKDHFGKYRTLYPVFNKSASIYNHMFGRKDAEEKDIGVRCVYVFENGYGASVIRTLWSYGGKEGLWELALLDARDKSNTDLIYNKDFSDVMGNLTWTDVQFYLKKIQSYERIENDTTIKRAADIIRNLTESRTD